MHRKLKQRLNMSLGGGLYEPLQVDAIANITSLGKLLVIAAVTKITTMM